MNKLDEILISLNAYNLNRDIVAGGVDFSVKEHYAMYPELKKAKDEIKALMLEIVNNPYEMGITDLEKYEYQTGKELVVVDKASLQRIIEQL